jgi:hypothetical protein
VFQNVVEEDSEDHQEVSIFSFKKTIDSQEISLLQLAQKGCQRLKSLKYGFKN